MAEIGFLLAEDEALKAKLSGLTVPVRGDADKRVKVWFRMPEREKERDYPYITIDLIDIVFAADRAHSAQVTGIDYWPSEYATFAEYAAAKLLTFDEETDVVQATWWHPYDIIYQVSTHCRSAQHDRLLTARLLGTAYLPDRWGYLHVPADDSERWLDRVGWSQADYYDDAAGTDTRRVFRKVYNVSVSAHVPPEDPFLFKQVLTVAGTLTTMDETETLATWEYQPTP